MTHRSTIAAIAVAAMGVVAMAAPAAPASAADGDFTGALTVSSTTTTVGAPITVTETAVNLGSTQIPFITVGIRRLGFTVVSAVKPRTGICRIAGSATCSSLLLAPHETQSYTLTLTANTTGTFHLQGWTTQPSTGRGVSSAVDITVN